MEYKPLESIIKVGHTREYNPLLEGAPRYAWETLDKSTFSSSQSLEDFSRLLRMLNVHPSQIDNLGTENPIFTYIMPENELDYLIKELTRPLVLLTKLTVNDYIPTKFNRKYNVFMDSLFSIGIGESLHIVELREIPVFINSIGCTEEDIKLFQQVGLDYAPLDKNYQYYISNSLVN